MILRLLVACFFVGSTIFFAEVARMNKWVSGERARKLVHILVGIWGAWLPLWLGYRSIMALGVLLIIGVFIAARLPFIKSIRSISRSTVGEYLFPVSMILLAIFFKNDVIFAAAMLQLGIADGMAAVIGTRYGKRTTFKIMGSRKSKHGTLTFFVLSTAILVWAIWALRPDFALGDPLSALLTVTVASVMSVGLTTLELVSNKGTDNITVPLATALLLSLV